MLTKKRKYAVYAELRGEVEIVYEDDEKSTDAWLEDEAVDVMRARHPIFSEWETTQMWAECTGEEDYDDERDRDVRATD